MQRNNVAREGRPCVRIGCHPRPPEEQVRCAQNFAQVTVAHGSGRHSARSRLLFPAAYPLLGPEETQPAAVSIELSGNEDRTADIEPELVKAKWRRATRFTAVGAQVSRPAIGVKRGVAEVLHQVAMEILCAALGDEPDLS